jgi:hypothetical protein
MARAFALGSLRRRLFGARLAPVTLGLGLVALLVGAGCSSSSDGCTARFSGAVAETGTVTSGCGTLSQAADGGASGDSLLTLNAMSAHIGALAVSIDLGATPAVGTLSSETVMNWSATGVASGTAACGYEGGNEAVPTGSFTLTITDATTTVAHGTLDMTLYVHAPPATDCGASETEDAHFTF